MAKKNSISPEQTLAKWIANESRLPADKEWVHEEYGNVAGNGPRVTVDGITFEKVYISDTSRYIVYEVE